MNGVAQNLTVTPSAGAIERQWLARAAARASASRAVLQAAEQILDCIERRLQLPPGPQGDPRRPPTGGPRVAERFLGAAAAYLRMDFGSVAVVLDGTWLGPVLWGKPSRSVNDLHFIFGEGPAMEAGVSGTFVEVRDLREAVWRWPAFVPAALDLGVRSMWCVPLPDPHKPGLVLAFTGRDPIPFNVDRYEQLTRVTRIAQRLIVDHPATITARSITRRIEQSVRDRAVMYQASGVLAGRLSIDCESALGLMRLHAWAEQRALREVSSELVASVSD